MTEPLAEQMRALVRTMRQTVPETMGGRIAHYYADKLDAFADAADRAAAERPAIFQWGTFTAHSGATLPWKFEADSLSDADLETLAEIAVPLLGIFSSVEPVPKGGNRLADAVRRCASLRGMGRPLIVDDVLTTGASMEALRAGRDAVGVVILARGPWPSWVTPLFVTHEAMQAQAAEASAREAGLEQRVAELKREAEEHDAEHFIAKAHNAALVAQLEACDEARQSNADDVAPLVAALERIATAKRRLAGCPNPGECLYPQYHSDDETHDEFSKRLRDEARAALAAAPESARALTGLVAAFEGNAETLRRVIGDDPRVGVWLTAAAHVRTALGMEVGDAE
jgi:hypothetical protein